MKPIHTFRILPSLPEPLKALHTIAFNLRWAWNHDTIELFRRLDRDLWETVFHNPVRMLGTIDQTKLEAAAADATLVRSADFVASWAEANRRAGRLERAQEQAELRRKGAVCGDPELQGVVVGRVAGDQPGCGVEGAVRLRSVAGVDASVGCSRASR